MTHRKHEPIDDYDLSMMLQLGLSPTQHDVHLLLVTADCVECAKEYFDSFNRLYR